MAREVRERRFALRKPGVRVGLAKQGLRPGLVRIGVESENAGVPNRPCRPAKVQPVMMRASDVTSS